MKQILYIIVFVLLLYAVSADMYIDERFYTPGDIYWNGNFFAGGNINIEGMQTKYVYPTGDYFDRYRMYRMLTETMTKEWDDLLEYEQPTVYAFEHKFVTRQEMIEYNEYIQSRMDSLAFEIEAIQMMFDKTELCNMRLYLAKRKNITKLSCNGLMYYDDGNGGFLSIK